MPQSLTRRAPSLLGLLLLLALPVRAGDFYVDAANGDDTNSGTTENDAWKTLSHAVPSLPAGQGHVLHIAPGVYDAALGESFPIAVRSGLTLIGEQGHAVTIVDGDGSGALFTWIGESWVEYATATHFKGLWLRDAVRGMDGTGLGPDTTYHAVLSDGRLSGFSEAGVRATVWNFFFDDHDLTLLVDLERMQVESCGHGVYVDADSSDFGFSTAIARAKDSVIRSCGTGLAGFSLHMAEAYGGVSAERCYFEGNGTGAVGEGASARDCLFVSNGLALGAVAYSCSVEGCTITANTTGVAAGWMFPEDTRVANSIVHGNGDDLNDLAIEVRYSCIGERGWAGKNGNISADPDFADPAAGDYRLRFGSPCADAGDPGAIPRVDLAGTPRPVDGDLDTEERVDMGAYELALLFVQGVPRLGSTVELELWGPAGGGARLYWTRGPTVPPIQTPWGEFDLDRAKVRYFGGSATAPGPPVTIPFTIPNVPALVGESISFQAFATAGAPGTGAFTNAVTLTIEE